MWFQGIPKKSSILPYFNVIFHDEASGARVPHRNLETPMWEPNQRLNHHVEDAVIVHRFDYLEV